MTLEKISWSFRGHIASAEEFNAQVLQYQIDIQGTGEHWKPEEIVFDCPKVFVEYEAWVKGASEILENEKLSNDDEDAFQGESEDGYYQVEIIATIKADNGANFSALEFLMKVHNQQSNKELGDHVFFEGIGTEFEIVDGAPLCYIRCGS